MMCRCSCGLFCALACTGNNQPASIHPGCFHLRRHNKVTVGECKDNPCTIIQCVDLHEGYSVNVLVQPLFSRMLGNRSEIRGFLSVFLLLSCMAMGSICVALPLGCPLAYLLWHVYVMCEMLKCSRK